MTALLWFFWGGFSDTVTVPSVYGPGRFTELFVVNPGLRETAVVHPGLKEVEVHL